MRWIGSLRGMPGALALVLALQAGALAAQQPEASGNPPPPGTPMVFVNTQALLPQMPGAREAQEAFNQELTQYRAEMQTLQAEVDSLLTAYRRQESMLSADAKEQRQQEILGKQREIQNRAAELERQAGERQQELLAPILDRVHEMVEELRREREYTIVFDIAGSGVVAADPGLDITSLVLERIRGLAGEPAASNPRP